jgi:hypothetical protein
MIICQSLIKTYLQQALDQRSSVRINSRITKLASVNFHTCVIISRFLTGECQGQQDWMLLEFKDN